MAGTLRAIFEMARPPQTATGAGATAIALMVFGSDIPISSHLVAPLAIGTVMAGGFIINDCFDLERDRINDPHRPLPAGRIGRRTAILAALVLFGIAFAGAFAVSQATGFIILVDIGLLLAYSPLKVKSGIAGNLAVAALVGSVALVVMSITGPSGAIIVIGVLASGMTLSQEWMFDLRDLPGDKAAGVRTLANVYGRKATYMASSALLCLMAVFIIAVAVLGNVAHPIWFGGLALAGVISFAFVVWLFVAGPNPRRFRTLCWVARASILMITLSCFGLVSVG